MQYRLCDHEGQFRWITDSGVPRYGRDGAFRGYIGACVDITELLEKDRALREIEERIALAAEVARLGVWELNTITYDLWVSASGRKLFGFDADRPITYAEFADRVHPADRARRDANIKRAIATQSAYEMEYRIHFPDEVVRWVGARARYIPGEDGEPGDSSAFLWTQPT